MKQSVLGPGWQAAGSILGMLDGPQDGFDKAGNCLDPDEMQADHQLQIWLDPWKRNKSNPKQKLDLVPASWQPPTPLPSAWEDTERCGGTPRKRPDHSLVVPQLLGEEREKFFSCHSPGQGRVRDLADLDSTASSGNFFLPHQAATPSSMGRREQNDWKTSSGSSVSSCFSTREWGAPPKVSGNGSPASGMRTSPPDSRTPFKGGLGSGLLYRVFTVWTGLVRKIPVTVEMLRWWLRSYLLDGGRDRPEAAALWSAMCLGWFFMLRASQYLPP